MTKHLFLLLLFTGLALAPGCSIKHPSACITPSSPSPRVNREITISGACSRDAEWFVYTIDGALQPGSIHSDFEISFPTVGEHSIELTVYAKLRGAQNSKTSNCNNCTGKGKTSTNKLIIDVKP